MRVANLARMRRVLSLHTRKSQLIGVALFLFALPLPSITRLLVIAGYGSESLVAGVAWTSYVMAGAICFLLISDRNLLRRDQKIALFFGSVFIGIFFAVFVVASFALSYVEPYILDYSRVFLVGFLFLLFGIFAEPNGGQRKWFVASYVAVALIALAATDFDLWRIDFGSGYEGIEGHYLFVSDAVCLMAAMLIGGVRGSWGKLLLAVVTIFIVFLVGSRASLWCFLAAVFCVLAFTSGRALLASIVSAIVVGGILIPLLVNSDIPAVIRIMEPLTNRGGESGEARQYLFEVGWRAILDSPIAGDFGGQIHALGTFGSYIHNILSYWRQFGLLGLIFIVVVLVLVVRTMLTLLKSPRRSKDAIAGPALAVLFVALLSVSSRSFASPFIWIIFGLAFRVEAIARAVRWRGA